MILFRPAPVFSPVLPLLLGLMLVLLFAAAPRAADRARIEAFLNVTGFDVALDSIALSAADAPRMLNMDADAFGSDWHRLTNEVFDTKVMRNLAIDILEQTLSDDLLIHAVEFYSSDLGQRLVEAENTAHMITDSDTKATQGRAIASELIAAGSPRVEAYKRMSVAIDSIETSLRAIQEIQIRFLLSASAAGVVELQMDAGELRALMKSQERQLRIALSESVISGSAFVYRDFSDEDVLAYTEALEHPKMRLVYELLSAVQNEITANRFEHLANRMAELHPAQDI